MIRNVRQFLLEHYQCHLKGATTPGEKGHGSHEVVLCIHFWPTHLLKVVPSLELFDIGISILI